MCQAALAAIGVGAARQTSSRFRHLNGCSNSRQARGAPCREWTLRTALLQRPILGSEIKSIRVGHLRSFLGGRVGIQAAKGVLLLVAVLPYFGSVGRAAYPAGFRLTKTGENRNCSRGALWSTVSYFDNLG